MIPIRLDVQGFGPFVQRQHVDFAALGKHGLFVIHGPTGSGKSSLLDALTYALFDTTSGNERRSDDLLGLSRGELETWVELTFAHMGRTYRVTRKPTQSRPKKRGEGTTTAQATAQLLEIGDGEVLLEEGARQVTSAIEAMLKCDAHQFRQTVVLPQGAFRAVLTDAETRESTLKQLFDTRRFADVEERVKSYAKQLQDAVKERLAQRNAILERHGAEHLQALEALDGNARRASLEAEQERDAKRKALDHAIAAYATGDERDKQFAARRTVVATIAALEAKRAEIDADRVRLELHATAMLVAPKVEAARDAAAEAAKQAERLADATREHDEVEAALGTATEARDAHLLQAEEIAGVRSEVERLAHVRPDVERLAGAITAAEKASKAHELASAQLDQASNELAKVAQTIGEMEERRGTLQAAADRRYALEAEVREAEQRLRDRHAIDEARATLGGTSTGVATVEALLGPMTHALAARLEAGVPCPVCGSDHAHAADDAARQEADAALRDLLAGIDEAHIATSKAQAVVHASLERNTWSDADLPSIDALETALHDVRAQHAAAVQAHEAYEKLQRDLQGVVARRVSLDAARAQAAIANDDTRLRLTEATTKRDDLLERVDPRWRDPLVFEARLQALIERAETYERKADALETAFQTAREQKASKSARLVEVTNHLEDARTRADATDAAMRTALIEQGFTTEEGAANPSAFESARLGDAERERLTASIERHDDALRDARAKEQHLADVLNGVDEPNLEELERVRTEAQGAAEAADQAFRTLEAAARTLQDAVLEAQSLTDSLAQQEVKQRKAQHLAEVLTGSAKGTIKLGLERYVLREILGVVLANANRQLERMTGRYRLRVTDRENASSKSLDLDVEDAHAGLQVRKASTLSGGEGFQASLALALGLSEAAERTSGAVELGALFIDEGFGSLDADALSKVTQVLRRLPEAQRRMVGVITHVDALKDRLDAQLLVVPSELGSTLRHRTD